MRIFSIISIVFIITAIFLTGCGSGGSASTAGGSTVPVAQATVPLKLSMSLINHPYGAPSKAPKMSSTTLEELESSGKMGIMIWDISSASSNSTPAPSKKSASAKSAAIDLYLPEYNQVFSDGISNFKFMGGAFVDYSSHSATVDVLPGNKLAVFSFALLNQYDPYEQAYSWEPVYVGVDIIDVNKGESSSKTLSLYEGNEFTPSQLSSAGLNPDLNWRIAMNPSVIGQLPEALGMFAYNPQIGEIPQVIFNVGDHIAGKLEMDYPPIISADYYYTIQFSISKTGSSTTYSNTVYLRPNSSYTKLIAYDTNNNPLTDFTPSIDNTSLYFNPSSSYGGYLDSNGTIAKPGIYIFDFSMISNHDTTASQFQYYINVLDPNQQSINPSLAFTQINQGVFPPDSDHQNFYVSTANGNELFKYSGSQNITFTSGKAIDLGSQPSTPPSIADVYSNSSTQDFTVSPMNYYAFVPPLYLISDPENDQTTAPQIMITGYDNLNDILYFVLMPGGNSTHTTAPSTITLNTTNNAYFPPAGITAGYAANENTNSYWDLVFSSGELFPNTHLNQNKILDLGTTDPSSNIPTVSSVYSSGSDVVNPVSGHYYAYVPYFSASPSTDTGVAPVIKVTAIDNINNTLDFEITYTYLPSLNTGQMIFANTNDALYPSDQYHSSEPFGFIEPTSYGNNYLIYYDGSNLITNTLDSIQRKALDLGTTQPSSYLSISSVQNNTSSSTTISPLANHYYAIIPSQSTSPSTDSTNDAWIIFVNSVDNNGVSITVYYAPGYYYYYLNQGL